MSSFDKYVAALLGRIGDGFTTDQKKQILNSIHECINYYQQIESSSAVKARREQAARQKAKEAESRHINTRHVRLPQLSPFQLNSLPPEQSMDAKLRAGVRRDSKKRKRGEGGIYAASSKRRSGGGTTAPSTGRGSKRSVKLYSIDLNFSKKVEEWLRALESGMPLNKAKAPHNREDICAAAMARRGHEPSAGDMVMKWKKSASIETQPPRKFSSASSSPPPPPLDCAAMAEAGDVYDAELNSHDPLTMSNPGLYHGMFKDFTFGHPPAAEDGKHSSSDGENAEEDAEEFIDDHEDARRRTIQMQRPSRPAISDSSLDIDEARISNFPTTPKSKDKVKTISRVLVRHFLFSTLDDSDIARFASIMDVERFEAGEHVLEKDEANDTFFIVLDGEAETTQWSEAGEPKVVPLVRGSTFGDLSLMYEVTNEAAVVARKSLLCASLERRTYKMLTSRAMEEKHHKYVDFLSSLPMMTGISSFELERVAECLKESCFVEGQKIIAAGAPTHWLYIVVEGSLSVMVPSAADGEDMVEVAQLHRGDFAGHIEFIHRHVSVADVIVSSPTAKTARLGRSSYDKIPREIAQRLARSIEEDPSYVSYQTRMHGPSPPPLDMTRPFDAPPAYLQRTILQRGEM